jgi:Fic family protein
MGNKIFMVSVKAKSIKGKTYLYAEYSFRLPNGKINKISKIIKNRQDKEKETIKEYFRKKELGAYKKYAVDTYKTDQVFTEDTLGKIEAIKLGYKRLSRNLTKKQMSDILDRFSVNFTYESNAIEGNSLTLKDVTLILTERIVPKDKDLREIYETRNSREANGLLFKNKIKIEIKDIIRLHKILVKDTGVSFGFKKLPNFLLMRGVKTTKPQKVEGEMEKLVDWYNSLKGKYHPLKLAADFHGKFEKIHPFEDGNGRVGRVLINAILLNNGYPPLIIRKSMRVSYFSALEAYDHGYKAKFERFLLDKFNKTFNNFFKVYINYI